MQFALDLARSADDPSRPDSHLGNKAPNFVVDDFAVSYGNPQTVQVNDVHLGKINLRYRVNGGRVQTKSTREWQGGLRYGDEGDYWYHRMRGTVTGTKAGDSVEVWFTSTRRHKKSDSFTYEVRSDSNADVVLVWRTTAETARCRRTRTRRLRTTSSTTPRRWADTPHDVYDYDAEDRKAPHPLALFLSHFDAIIWYTANDNVTREGATPGVADLEAHRTITAVRDFVNEGGRVALQGVNAGRQYDLVEYPQEGYPASQCDGDLQTTDDDGKCQPLSNDFAQYYLGSYVRGDGGGQNEEREHRPGHRSDRTAGRLERDTERADSAENHSFVGIETGTHLVTSSILEVENYPQFASEQAADWVTTGDKPFDPHTGEWYMTSQNVDEGYKRLRDDRSDRVLRTGCGQPVVLHLLQHGAGLGLRVRGGADAEAGRNRQRRLGHAA